MSKLHLVGDTGPANQLIRPSTSGLVYVQDDTTYQVHRRVGRFCLTRDEASSVSHLMNAVNRMQEKMIAGLARMGYQYVGNDFEFRGPLDHIDISEDANPDPGSRAAPDPRDRQASDAWARAERSRVAKKVGDDVDLVDYELVTEFRVRVPGTLRRAA